MTKRQTERYGTPARTARASGDAAPTPLVGERGTGPGRGDAVARWDGDHEPDRSASIGVLDGMMWRNDVADVPASHPADVDTGHAHTPGWFEGRQDDGASTVTIDRPMTSFDIAAYGLGIAAFAGVMLICLAVLAMGGLTTIDVVVGLVAGAAAVACGFFALARLRREPTAGRRFATAVMAVCAIGLPIVWTVLWNMVVGL
jgi:hypothetical protein